MRNHLDTWQPFFLSFPNPQTLKSMRGSYAPMFLMSLEASCGPRKAQGTVLASCWASYWASCWHRVGIVLALCWRRAGISSARHPSQACFSVHICTYLCVYMHMRARMCAQLACMYARAPVKKYTRLCIYAHVSESFA